MLQFCHSLGCLRFAEVAGRDGAFHGRVWRFRKAQAGQELRYLFHRQISLEIWPGELLCMLGFLRTGMFVIRENDGCVAFAVKLHPRAKKDAVSGELGEALKLSLTAPPLEGRANEACIAFLAKLLKVPRSSVTIASGHTNRNKVIRVAGVTGQYVRDRLHP